jgi:hypothetical protein
MCFKSFANCANGLLRWKTLLLNVQAAMMHSSICEHFSLSDGGCARHQPVIAQSASVNKGVSG